MKKVTLTNDFHNTECVVLFDFDDAEAAWDDIQMKAWGPDATPSARAKYRRIKNALCGSHDCQCGTVR